MQKMKNKGSHVDRNVKESEVMKKERHLVSWTPEEDDILREQIRLHGIENWVNIASKFKDKTTRQCRRRWCSYLSSDFKRGGWTPEEDMLLCEAQKLHGNRWTEIAKVLPGRTDNAVKNRFSTLCKRRANNESVAKENNGFIHPNNKRVIDPNRLNNDGSTESAATLKKTRADIPSTSGTHRPRPPFGVLNQNIQTGANNLLVQQQDGKNNTPANINDAGNKHQGPLLTKNGSTILAQMQQEELLGALAVKANSEDTDQSLVNLWQVNQDWLGQSKECDPAKMMDGHSKREITKLRMINEGYQPSLRQPDVDMNFPRSSEYRTGATMLTQPDHERTETGEADLCAVTNRNIEVKLQATSVSGDHGEGNAMKTPSRDEVRTFQAPESIQPYDEIATDVETDIDFSSPMGLTPFFRTIAAEVPTPHFSESEKHFLTKTLGLEYTPPNQTANRSKHPTCKRFLLQSLSEVSVPATKPTPQNDVRISPSTTI